MLHLNISKIKNWIYTFNHGLIIG